MHGMRRRSHANKRGENGHHQHRHGTGSHKDRGILAGHGTRIHHKLGDCNHKWQRHHTVCCCHKAFLRLHLTRLGVHVKRYRNRDPTHGDKQPNEEEKQARVGNGSRKVDACTRDHKERRDEKPVANGFKARLQVLAAIWEKDAQHKARCKGTQNRVKAGRLGKEEQKHEKQHNQPKRRLGAGTRARPYKVPKARTDARRGRGEMRNAYADQEKHHKDNHRNEQRPRGEKQRHRNDRQYLAGGAICRDSAANARVGEVASAHDGC